jgi:hypothetical protein
MPAQRGRVAGRRRTSPDAAVGRGRSAADTADTVDTVVTVTTGPERPVLAWRAQGARRDHPVERLATVLADAMLAGSWTEPALTSRVRYVDGGGRRPWHALLARQVLAGYPSPPVDRPRELAAFVAASGTLQDQGRAGRGPIPERVPAARIARRPGAGQATTAGDARRPPRPTRGLVAPTRMLYRSFEGPVLDDAAALADYLDLDLAELVRYADTDLRTRRARSPALRHYRYRWIERTAGPRLLEIPRHRMAAVQRRLLRGLLDGIPDHPAVHGFVRGRSARTGAEVHAGASVVICLDLASFFPSVTAGRVWGMLRAAGYPEPVAHLLTGLLTHAVPAAVIAAMPANGAGPGGDPRAFRLRRYLARPHLPQGAPTSPAVANLVCWPLDRRLDAYASACGARYTRYADDLTFSGGAEWGRGAGRFIAAVAEVVRAEGFRLNPAKTRVRGAHQRQAVTGIVVNAHPNVPRPEADRLRAVLHDCLVHGPAAANRSGVPDFRAHLLGRISWVAQLNPVRGRRLQAAFDRIDWS